MMNHQPQTGTITMKNILVLLATLSTLTACNTFQGIGQDIEAAGEAISGTAEKTKDKM
jgi:predicted small secreted protein